MKQKRMMGIILAVLVIAVGYLFYVTNVCRVEIENNPSIGTFRVKNPLLWQMYVSKIGECNSGRLLIYPLKPSDTSPPVEVTGVKLVLGIGDYPYESVDETKRIIFTWDIAVENGEAVAAISMRSRKQLTPEEIEKYGHKAVRQVMRSMLQPVKERIEGDEEQGTAWYNSLSRMGLLMEFNK